MTGTKPVSSASWPEKIKINEPVCYSNNRMNDHESGKFLRGDYNMFSDVYCRKSELFTCTVKTEGGRRLPKIEGGWRWIYQGEIIFEILRHSSGFKKGFGNYNFFPGELSMRYRAKNNTAELMYFELSEFELHEFYCGWKNRTQCS